MVSVVRPLALTELGQCVAPMTTESQKVRSTYDRQNLRSNEPEDRGFPAHSCTQTKKYLELCRKARGFDLPNPVPSRRLNQGWKRCHADLYCTRLMSKRKGKALVLDEVRPCKGVDGGAADLHLVFVGGDATQNGMDQ